MRKLLEDALRSGDVLELESAIISAQNNILASSSSLRQESVHLSDILLHCRKALVRYLERCGPLLKPLRRACRNFDAEALDDALHKAYLAPRELRCHIQTDIQQAEALRRRILHAAEDAEKLLNCSDWRELEHFLDVNTALLPDRMVVALMRRREALFAQLSGTFTETMQRVAGPSLSVRYTSVQRDNTDRDVVVVSLIRNLERDEEDSRRVLLEAEHTNYVLCLKSEMDAMAPLLLLRTDGDCPISTRHPRLGKEDKLLTREGTYAPLPVNMVTNGGGCDLSASAAVTPNVSPIKVTALLDSTPRVERRLATVTTSPQSVRGDNSLSCIVARDSVYSLPRERRAVVLPKFWAHLRALMREEDIRRHDIEGSEDFERSVFLLPLAARSSLLTRIFPRRPL